MFGAGDDRSVDPKAVIIVIIIVGLMSGFLLYYAINNPNILSFLKVEEVYDVATSGYWEDNGSWRCYYNGQGTVMACAEY